MTPFIMKAANQYRPGPAPALSSPDYTSSYNETKDCGSATSSVRTSAQTDTALFWGLGRPDAQYNAAIRATIPSRGQWPTT